MNSLNDRQYKCQAYKLIKKMKVELLNQQQLYIIIHMKPKTPIKKTYIETHLINFPNKNTPRNNTTSSYFSEFYEETDGTCSKPKLQEQLLKSPQVFLSKKNKIVYRRKCTQQNNIFRFKSEPKEYRQAVISQQLVRSSKFYKYLQEQVLIEEARSLKQIRQLEQIAKKGQLELQQIQEKNQEKKIEIDKLQYQLRELQKEFEREENLNNILADQVQYFFGNEGSEGEQQNEEGEGEEEGQQQQQEEQLRILSNASGDLSSEYLSSENKEDNLQQIVLDVNNQDSNY